MTKGLKIWLYTCIGSFILGVALLIGTTANAAEVPKPDTTTSVTEKPNGETVTNTKVVQPSGIESYFAPGGIITISIGGIFLIVSKVKEIKQLDVNGYKSRAEAAEKKATDETDKLSKQIERLEKKLDDALKDVESKHDEWIAEVAHRRKLELLLAENGIAVPPTETILVVDHSQISS